MEQKIVFDERWAKVLTGALSFSCAIAAFAADDRQEQGQSDDAVQLDEIVVTESWPQFKSLNTTEMTGKAIAKKQSRISDTSALFDDVPGVSRYGSGGLSSLPVIHGLNDDRVKVQINGMSITSACANHMNPPLSYIDMRNVEQATVVAGITPVSVGGDSLGGTIILDAITPRFATAEEGTIFGGSISSFYRTNGEAFGGSVTLNAAGEHVALSYTASHTESDNYKAGGGFKVKSSQYEAQNHSMTLALGNDDHQLVVNAGQQNIPRQGFPNARMDMVDNDSTFGNVRYKGKFGWGNLETRFYYEHTRHEMNFLPDKRPGDMPMKTVGKNLGYLIKAEIPLTDRDTLRIGNEYHRNELDDWWPPVAGSMMMGPEIFWNVRNGERDRIGTFAEWEARWTEEWSSLLGLRHDHVSMNADTVQPYSSTSMMHRADRLAAGIFNGRSRDRTDDNFDLTALVRYTPNDTSHFEAGYARKNRSPNLYERYAWGLGSMAMYMNGWFGDGNGYVGDPDLEPEVAHTISATFGWHDARQQKWEVKITPYYTYVEDYIDVDRCPVTPGTACTAANLRATDGFVFLKFANHDAQLYGVDVSGKALLGDTRFGQFTGRAILGYVRGENLDTGDNLYHMMPVNGKLTVDHQWGGWSNAVELQLVAPKTDVTDVRNELKTGGYALVNLRTGYEWKHVRVDAGLDNLLDKNYDLPLGGAYLGSRPMAYGTALPGMGRSAYVGVTFTF
ncbi:TonB-dependent receptor [Methylocaldum marinum]|uniref:TonB-dependent receptor n=1 Tax=Methylocaldum marinum TaxID=1432792 RepID=A0A250KXH0_9GAMM|nr:TonB-dependent receptor [Methylocaldum marinum]BBA36363.1 TonB-dependent receptor [Methylocaldum marinum]